MASTLAEACREVLREIPVGVAAHMPRAAVRALTAMSQLLPHEDELQPLAERIAKGRTKYPRGCTVLSVLDEAGEVLHAINKYESVERARDELLDVAATAMRLYLGEIDTELVMEGLVQKRRSGDEK